MHIKLAFVIALNNKSYLSLAEMLPVIMLHKLKSSPPFALNLISHKRCYF